MITRTSKDMAKITKATIERLMESQGASEVNAQTASARFDQCTTEKERAELLKQLTRKGGGVKAPAQNKAVGPEDTKAPAGSPEGKKTKADAQKTKADTKGK